MLSFDPEPILEFWAPGQPRPQGSKVLMTVGMPCRACFKKKTVMVESANDKLKVWRDSVRSHASDAISRRYPRSKAGYIVDDAVVISAHFYIDRPKSHLKLNGELRAGFAVHKTSTPDLSKYVRAVEDSMTDAGVWKDDSVVCGYMDVTKEWCNPGEQGVQIAVYRVTGS